MFCNVLDSTGDFRHMVAVKLRTFHVPKEMKSNPIEFLMGTSKTFEKLLSWSLAWEDSNTESKTTDKRGKTSNMSKIDRSPNKKWKITKWRDEKDPKVIGTENHDHKLTSSSWGRAYNNPYEGYIWEIFRDREGDRDVNHPWKKSLTKWTFSCNKDHPGKPTWKQLGMTSTIIKQWRDTSNARQPNQRREEDYSFIEI